MYAISLADVKAKENMVRSLSAEKNALLRRNQRDSKPMLSEVTLNNFNRFSFEKVGVEAAQTLNLTMQRIEMKQKDLEKLKEELNFLEKELFDHRQSIKELNQSVGDLSTRNLTFRSFSATKSSARGFQTEVELNESRNLRRKEWKDIKKHEQEMKKEDIERMIKDLSRSVVVNDEINVDGLNLEDLLIRYEESKQEKQKRFENAEFRLSQIKQSNEDLHNKVVYAQRHLEQLIKTHEINISGKKRRIREIRDKAFDEEILLEQKIQELKNKRDLLRQKSV